MSSASHELAAVVESNPKAFFVARNPSNYLSFLRLYERLGYGPADGDELRKWRERSLRTWEQMDEQMPGTCTGSFLGEDLASAAGTLPFSAAAITMHSYCMHKIPIAAVGLYAQSLESLRWMNVYHDVDYFAGSYSRQSRFTPLLQRPNGRSVPDQLDIEVFRCSPSAQSPASVVCDLIIGGVSAADGAALLQDHQAVYSILAEKHSALERLQSKKFAVIKDAATGANIAVVFIPEVPPEFTAFNVLLQVWVFPTDYRVPLAALCGRLRGLCELRGRVLNIPYHDSDTASLEIPGEVVSPCLWAFTPRKSVPVLRETFRAAFLTIFDKIPKPEALRITRAFSKC
jgi:hypothetical protein